MIRYVETLSGAWQGYHHIIREEYDLKSRKEKSDREKHVDDLTLNSHMMYLNLAVWLEESSVTESFRAVKQLFFF